MSLRTQLRTDLKAAMKRGDNLRKRVIRGIMATINEAEQRKREELVKEAMSKHNVQRPQDQSEEAMTAYNTAVTAATEAENVEREAALSDAEIESHIQKLAKQRQESIADAQQANRDDLVETEQAELDILQDYLPQQMTREEIEVAAREIIEETGASGMRDMGQVMGPLMDRHQGRIDGKVASSIVRELLSR